MKDVCTLNQSITDKFKHLDNEQYQQEYAEHCRKMSIIDSYEDEIKEVLFLLYSMYEAVKIYLKHKGDRWWLSVNVK